MVINPQIAAFIYHYGYVAIFALVFSQEIGIPNPVPNELVLLFAGYLAYTHALNLFGILLTVILADFTGTSLVYGVVYFFGEAIMLIKWRWLVALRGKVQKLQNIIAKREVWGIFLGRLIPYVRGYTSVAAGLLQVRPKVFLPVVLTSAITWSGGYVVIAYLLGSKVSSANLLEIIVFVILIVIAASFAGRFLYHRFTNPQSAKL